MLFLKRVSVLVASCCIAAGGCSSGYVMETAPVRGTVSCNGETLTEGYLIFTPIVDASADSKQSGKSGYATIQSDGTYEVQTYEEGDGALIGKHEVRIYKPDPEDDEQYVKNNFACGNQVLEVTVEDKENIIDLDPAVN